MAREAGTGPAQQKEPTPQVAAGGPVGIGAPRYGDLAARLFDNGYEPLPILPGTKRPAPVRWSSVAIDDAQIADWAAQHSTSGVGLRTGALVAIDIDVEDPDLAHVVSALVEDQLGRTLIRVGRWPRRLLVYRVDEPFPKLKLGPVEVLGLGQQFVAFGRHPDTGRAYGWVTGESPADVPLADLPLLSRAAVERLLAETGALTRQVPRVDQQNRSPCSSGADSGTGAHWIRDAAGLVVDGRDGWLSTIAFHAVHDVLDRGGIADVDCLAGQVWDRFSATTELTRARQGGRNQWSPSDAERKVADKLRLHSAGQLPARKREAPVAVPLGNLLSAPEARAQVAEAIDDVLRSATDWWSGDRTDAPPVTGIRATVGLGKSAMSRQRIADWQKAMRDLQLPHRVLVVTPSHALAEEAAVRWRELVAGSVAVLRGYEGRDPGTGRPMCEDLEMVQLALAAGFGIGHSVCRSSATWSCPHYAACLKQRNRREVASADIVLAPYDVLFTGPAAGKEPFGLIVIDEGCWQRAMDDLVLPPLETMGTAGLSGVMADEPERAERTADLIALRQQAITALEAVGARQVRPDDLISAGLTVGACAEAARLEMSLVLEAEIYPGMKPRARKMAVAAVRKNVALQRMARLWQALAMILAADPDAPVLTVASAELQTGATAVTLHGRKRLTVAMSGSPILHLDAAMRAELAGLFLPALTMRAIEASQPNQHVTMVTGSFGKSSLCPGSGLAQEEVARRSRRLREVVDHVRWQALRFAPRRVLVVTYKAIEVAFAGIPGVETAHFNAIAGLDRFADVGLLIVIGRPLPSSADLGPLCASLFGHHPTGHYQPVSRSVHLRDGGQAVVRTIAHPDPKAELLRAAICDDELIQAIGRGRGVNRSDDTPLEVQLMADVALPLVHDRVLSWEQVAPNIVQRMLLAGMAVSSPADAVAVHPGLFTDAEQAKKALVRAGFKGQTPISITYREMSLKSARYLRGGRGRSWQRAWWLAAVQPDARQRLEAAVGPLADWQAEE
jgi:hypothetical protein